MGTRVDGKQVEGKPLGVSTLIVDIIGTKLGIILNGAIDGLTER